MAYAGFPRMSRLLAMSERRCPRGVRRPIIPRAIYSPGNSIPMYETQRPPPVSCGLAEPPGSLTQRLSACPRNSQWDPVATGAA